MTEAFITNAAPYDSEPQAAWNPDEMYSGSIN
jgi:hypothetical protein